MTDDVVEMSVDELARAAGTLSSTVRLYQNRGLLPPPRRQGRRAVYGPLHLDRLRLIAELQERGHSLAGIRELVDGWDSGRALPEVLGVEGWTAPEPIRLSVADLVQRFAGVDVRADDITRSAELGLLEIDGVEVVVRDPQFIELGVELTRLGLPVSAVLAEWEALSELTDLIADRFARVLLDHLWSGAAVPSPTDLERLTELLAGLRNVARQVTTLALDESLRRTAEVTAERLTRLPRP